MAEAAIAALDDAGPLSGDDYVVDSAMMRNYHDAREAHARELLRPARKAAINEPCKLACADCQTYCDCARDDRRTDSAEVK